VARWYREHGYQFLVVTDHEYLTDVAPLNQLFGADGQFLVIPGEEVTQWSANREHPSAHINSINPRRIVYPIGERKCTGGACGATAAANVPLRQTFKLNAQAILAAGGIPQINHPNAYWSVKPEDLFDVPDHSLFEIWNGLFNINNLGGTDDAGRASPSTEEMWDQLLSHGQILWAVGSDDSAEYHDLANPVSARPGQAWVVVRAPALTVQAIATALRAGDFYASNGITLDDVVTGERRYSVFIRADSPDPVHAPRYTTQFVGTGGKVLAQVSGTHPSYAIRGDEGYVRASIMDSNGKRAWTQPIFLHGRKGNNP
jgi:hypothetical protein